MFTAARVFLNHGVKANFVDIVGKQFMAKIYTYNMEELCPFHAQPFEWLTDATRFTLDERLEFFWKSKRLYWIYVVLLRYFTRVKPRPLPTLRGHHLASLGFDLFFLLGAIGSCFLLLIFYYDKQYAEPAFWYARMICWVTIIFNLLHSVLRFTLIFSSFVDSVNFHWRYFFVEVVSVVFSPILNYVIMSCEFLWLFVKCMSTTHNFAMLDKINRIKYHVALTILLSFTLSGVF